MKIAFFNLNCILRDRLLSRKIVTVYGGLCPAVTPVWSPPLLRKGLYMNLLTECTQLVLHLGPPLHSFPFLLLILITLREHSSDFECKSSTASQWFLSRLDFLDLQLYLDFFLSFYFNALREVCVACVCAGGVRVYLHACKCARICNIWQMCQVLSPKLILRRLNAKQVKYFVIGTHLLFNQTTLSYDNALFRLLLFTYTWQIVYL